MRLINSKIYTTKEVMKNGECMMCGATLDFKEIEEVQYMTSNNLKATCCNFDYILLNTDNPDEIKVQVCAFVGE